MREAIRARLQLGISQRLFVAAYRHAIRHTSRLHLDQRMHTAIASTDDVCIPVPQQFVFAGRQQSQPRNRSLRIGQHRCEQCLITLAKTQRRRGTENIRVVGDATQQALFLFDEPQAKIISRAHLKHRQMLMTQIAPRGLALADILKSEHGLIQRRPTGIARYLQLRHQPIKRHFRIRERVDDDGPDLAQTVQERRARIHHHAQGQDVGEVTHHRLEFGQFATTHRRAYNEIALAGVAMQEHVIDGEQHHERRCLNGLTQLAYRVRQCAGQIHPLGGARTGHAHRPRLVGGQSERFQRAPQMVFPVPESTRQCVTAHPPLMPCREVAVLD